MNPIRITTDGAHGGSGGHRVNGQNAGNLSVAIQVRNGVGQLVGPNQKISFDPRTQQIFLSAIGGNGGHGGCGARGKAGSRGHTGSKGYHCQGGSGGWGGRGETGGSGGDGGDGGKGGAVEVTVLSSQAYLLKLLLPPSVKGGLGGQGGAGGRGGEGGEGGAGGAGDSWTYTESRYVAGRYEQRTIPLSAPGGSSGSRGPTGFDGYSGNAGQAGRDGTVQFCLKVDDTTIKRYAEIFSVSIIGPRLTDGAIYEPGAIYTLQGIQINNSSSMPVPKMDAPFQIALASNNLIAFEESSAIELPPIDAHSSTLQSGLQFRVRLIDLVTAEPFSKEVKLSYLLKMPGINCQVSFPASSTIRIVSAVQMLPPQLSENIISGENVPLCIRFSNLLSTALGTNSTSGRDVLLRLEAKQEGEQISIAAPGKSGSLKTFWEYNISLLEPKKETSFLGNLIFGHAISTYRPIHFTASLLLEREIIQKIDFSTIVSTAFVFDREADIILCVNRQTPASTIESWQKHLDRLSMKLTVWDVSLYKGFHFSHTIEGSTLKVLLKGKVVVLLNSPCPKLPTSLLNPEDVYGALKETGLYVIGDSLTLPAFSTHVFREYDSQETFLAGGDLSTKARIKVREVSILRPGKTRLFELGKELLQKVQTLNPAKRYFIRVIPGIKPVSGYIWKLKELGVLEVTSDDPLKLIICRVREDSIHITNLSRLFQAIKLLPFERKLELLQTNKDSASSVFMMAIQAELIGDLLPYFWHDSVNLLSLQEMNHLLRKLPVVKDSLLEREFVEALILKYELVLERMEEDPSLLSKRFKQISAKVKEILVEIRKAKDITEAEYREAKKQFRKKVQAESTQALLENSVDPYIKNALKIERMTYQSAIIE